MIGDSGLTIKLGASVNQSDRLTGISDYLGEEGMAEKLLWVAGILVAMLLMIYLLRAYNRLQQKKAQAKRAKKKAAKAADPQRRRSSGLQRPRSKLPRRR